MSDDMRDRLKAEFGEFDRATMAMGNAFGFIDDPTEWEGDPGEHVDVWDEAAGAARAVEHAAEQLADAARRVARDLELELPEEPGS